MITGAQRSKTADFGGSPPSGFEPAAVWMRWVLIAAAAYNLAWGALAVLSPTTMLHFLGVDPLPRYPELWQCIGMIVGVYGVGYGIAARNPYRHWPIVLVGFLGKLFGPIGFLNAVLAGHLPASLGWTIVTNDLIWWVPFAVILWGATRAHQSKSEQLFVTAPPAPIDPLGRMLSQFGSSLTELSRSRPVLVVLLRHSGCPFCRETLRELGRRQSEIESLGTQIALVHMGERGTEELLERNGLADLHRFHDPMCQLYDLFGLEQGRFRQLFGLKVLLRGIPALSRHGLGLGDGNILRMPGTFLMYRGQPVRAFRHRTAADRPDYVKLATLPDHCEVAPLTERRKSLDDAFMQRLGD